MGSDGGFHWCSVLWGERMMIYPAQFGLVLCLVVLLVCVLDWSYA